MRSTGLGDLDVSVSEIAVHVLGPGYGESIVLLVGRKILLGIDSCLMLAGRRHGSVYLRELGAGLDPDAIIVWVLSHFHFDHFRGMARVLETLRSIAGSVYRIVLPGSYTSADLARLIAEDAFETAQSSADYHLASDEYGRFRDVIARDGLGPLCVYPSNRFDVMRARVTVAGGNAVDLVVEGHSPPPIDVDRGLVRALREVAKGDANRDTANEDCTVLRVACGEFAGLFLGDVPVERSEELVQEWGKELCNGVSLLKVAHHGSEDGTSDKLLECLATTATGDAPVEKPLAVIAPFRAHGLPKESVVGMLRRRGFDVQVCGGRRSVDADARRELENEYQGVCEVEVVDMEQEQDNVIVRRYVFG